MTIISINGHNLYVEEAGPADGRAIFLLHHGLGSLKSWRKQVPELAAHGYRVIVYDRWGYGRSDPRSGFSMPLSRQDVKDLVSLMDYYDLEKAVLTGHSDGGTIALYFAAQFPQRVSLLVIVAAHIYLEEKMEPGIEGLRQLYEDQPKFREALRREHGDKVDDVFYGWYNGWREEGNQGWDMRPSLKHITCPVLVVQGLQDEHATPQHARDIAVQTADSELWLVPGGGHMLPQDNPTEFNNRVLAFSQKCHANERQSVVS
jgi:pimeloyl-ACP methyl ester carboxylesterase